MRYPRQPPKFLSEYDKIGILQNIYQKFQITLAHNLRSLRVCYFEETLLMVFQKHTSLCAAMFLAFVPTLSDANSACTKAAKNFNLCLDDKMDQKLLYLNKYSNVDETLLYYSGGILHNGPTLNKDNALTEQQDPSIQENTKNSNLIPKAQPTTTENPKPVYDEIKRKFGALSVFERKNVQKCRRYGSYTGKVDGIWGNETFRALKNFQVNSSNDTDRDNENGDISVIAKIKNLFSRKKSCYELVSKNFKI